MLAGFRADVAGWLREQQIAPTEARVAWATRMFAAQPAWSLQALAQAAVAATSRPDYLLTIGPRLGQPAASRWSPGSAPGPAGRCRRPSSSRRRLSPFSRTRAR